MKKYQILFVASVVFVFFLAGCGSTRKVPIPSFEALPSLKGKTSEEMTEKFGAPDRRYNGENNTLVSEYRWPAESKKAANAMMIYGTMGVYSGGDSFYVDMLRCWFKKNIVLNCTRIDETTNVSLPGLGELISMSPFGITGEAKQNIQPTESKSPPVVVAPPAPVLVKTTIKESPPVPEKTEEPAETITSSKSFQGKSIKTVIAKIIAGTDASGMTVTKKEKNSVMLQTAEGSKIIVNLKQLNKSTVLVELKTTGNPNMSQDFQSIYAGCK